MSRVWVALAAWIGFAVAFIVAVARVSVAVDETDPSGAAATWGAVDTLWALLALACFVVALILTGMTIRDRMKVNGLRSAPAAFGTVLLGLGMIASVFTPFSAMLFPIGAWLLFHASRPETS